MAAGQYEVKITRGINLAQTLAVCEENCPATACSQNRPKALQGESSDGIWPVCTQRAHRQHNTSQYTTQDQVCLHIINLCYVSHLLLSYIHPVYETDLHSKAGESLNFIVSRISSMVVLKGPVVAGVH